MNKIKSYNNISINKGYNKFILKYDWDFFITLTYESNRKPETIRNHIENIYNKNYWIKSLIWVKEYTKRNLPHLHIVMKTKDKTQSYKTLKKIFKQYGNVNIQYIDERETYGGYMFKGIDSNNSDWGEMGLQRTMEDEKEQLRKRYHQLELIK